MKYLHFSNNEIFDPDIHPCPKLRKIYELYTLLNENFEKIYTPNQNICIGESLMGFKGKLSWIQFIPSKRSRFGLKFFMLCESESSYIWKSLIYTGKDTEFNPKYAAFDATGSVVLTLCKKLLNKRYCLVMDNFYNSAKLFEYLQDKQTNVYGTVRPNRKNLPTNFNKNKLTKGELSWMKGNLIVMRWCDKRVVSLISAFHDTSFIQVQTKRGETVCKPQKVVDYNVTIGGVEQINK